MPAVRGAGPVLHPGVGLPVRGRRGRGPARLSRWGGPHERGPAHREARASPEDGEEDREPVWQQVQVQIQQLVSVEIIPHALQGSTSRNERENEELHDL